MRFGLTILPEFAWREAEPKWRAAEQLGFDHAWTYDHLTWAGLPDAPWFSATTTLTAAAMVTERIDLGFFVASPNFRHPGAFVREILALDDISAGRLLLGLGTGGNLDSHILGGPDLTVRQRVDRFEEFVGLLDALLTTDHVDHRGTFYETHDVRTLPGPVQQPRPPFIMAGNGPRSLRLALRYGQGWVTTGVKGDSQDDWWASLSDLSSKLDDLGATFPRYLNLDAGHEFSLSSVGAFEEMTGRASELGFTDLITHWPRPDSPYAGSVATLEQVASEVLPRWRG
ncbi:LLM class flavin-dependent oxidoreductase [Calidifontibacter sp. DB0510]|uniref:LLM class flavin-dependent oxidoreductase n=1 Tax=Metallococcus carri TaxID=1656884 RepID=A0A967B7L9_9MICO|nr:LLM class flavin-dependent oxidoreductase [Metallococcus carri]NHN56231.1 LLM class flavin-dependent oxidoreductase [Metallococcus carri]NOP38718.1 LLM class flavin-dependent oxidoreductase [Calidifontibacter sp. DB2511S]